MKNIYKIVFLVCILIASILTSCRKDIIDTNTSLKLKFSSDSILFDTVFVTLGSVTKRLKVYNPSEDKVIISKIKLAGGNNSFYRLNVDGTPTREIDKIEIEGKDSLYIFIEVTVDPNQALLPFIIKDSIEFTTNGNFQAVVLEAWGRNARFYRPDSQIQGLPPFFALSSNTTWTNDLPVVIFGYLVVDSGITLTIEAGTKVHFYNNSGMWVYKEGTLIVNGTLQDSVIFQGVRQEEQYKERPGQWDRIWINQGSMNNRISHAVIKNGFIGIQAENVMAFGETGPSNLRIENTQIRNMSGYGIFGSNYTIQGDNLLITNCGGYATVLVRGGNYRFRHCTFANYWTSSIRSTPTLFFNNYQVGQGNSISAKPLTACYFGNCIIYGNISNNSEVEYDSDPGAAFNFTFDHCLMKITDEFRALYPDRFINTQTNQDPQFGNPAERNFKLKANSPAIDAGNLGITNQAPTLQLDLLGNDRTSDGLPDLGAIEFIP